MKSILFDFGGTLDGDGTAWLDRFYPLYKEAGVEADKESFTRAFHRSDDHLPLRFDLQNLPLEKTLDLQVQCVLETLAPERASGAQGQALRTRLVGRFLEECRGHFRRNRPLLERLRGRYRLGIVSNFYGNLESVLAGEGLGGLFDAVADSGKVGIQKPEAGLFLHALRSLDASPAESVMVGDSIARDMRGAEGLKMPHALLGAPDAARCCPAAWTLKTLPELETLLA